jgi:uncharacterized protein (TIGR02118 family)
MVKVTIFYPNQEGSRFEWDYYLHIHMPMSIEKLGPTLKGVTIERGLGGIEPGSKPAYVALCHFTFDSVEAFLAAFLPNAPIIQGDMKGYTDITPLIQFSEIELAQE